MKQMKRKFCKTVSLLLLLLMTVLVPIQAYAEPSRQSGDKQSEKSSSTRGDDEEKDEDNEDEESTFGFDLEDIDTETLIIIGGVAAVAVVGIVVLVVVLATTKKKKTVQNVAPKPPVNDYIPPVEPVVQGGNVPVRNGWEPVSIEEQGMKVYIVGVSGVLRGREYPITGQNMIIGRAEESIVRYPADTKGVSRRHCQLIWKNGGLMLMDMGSTSGTFLQGKGQLSANVPVPLVEGEIFYLGSKENALTILVKL